MFTYDIQRKTKTDTKRSLENVPTKKRSLVSRLIIPLLIYNLRQNDSTTLISSLLQTIITITNPLFFIISHTIRNFKFLTPIDIQIMLDFASNCSRWKEIKKC